MPLHGQGWWQTRAWSPLAESSLKGGEDMETSVLELEP